MTRKFITFDLDGILINSAGLHDEAFVGALKAIGMNAAAETYLGTYGSGAAMESVSTRQKCEVLGVSEYYADIKEAKDKIFHSNRHRIEFSPWLLYDFARLESKGYEIAIVTNCTEAMAFVICDMIGIGGEYSVFAAKDGTRTKPDPALYREFMASYAMTDEDHWLALEDSDNGVTAAKAAGASMVIKTTYHETKERLRLCAF